MISIPRLPSNLSEGVRARVSTGGEWRLNQKGWGVVLLGRRIIFLGRFVEEIFPEQRKEGGGGEKKRN